MDVLFILKLILTPLLITLTTLASRHWGPGVGGWLVGLPLTSGPISVFLVLEQGRGFAATAAHNTLLGVIAVIGFCVTYARSARTVSWPVAISFSLSSYFLVVVIFSSVAISLPMSVLLVVAVNLVAMYITKPIIFTTPKAIARRSDIPLRMVTATIVVVTITAISTRLGPQLSGLLSTFPVFICVMSVFSHRLYGHAAVHQLQRGVIVGSFSFAAFFLVVSLTIRNQNLFVVYSLAVIAATAVNLVVFRSGALSRDR